MSRSVKNIRLGLGSSASRIKPGNKTIAKKGAIANSSQSTPTAPKNFFGQKPKTGKGIAPDMKGCC